jgi:hypothetical protein
MVGFGVALRLFGRAARPRDDTVIREGAIWFTIVSLVLVSLPSGCSYVFVTGPPTDHVQRASLACSDRYPWPVIDTTLAGLSGIRAVPAEGAKDVAAYFGLFAIFGISAIIGFRSVSQCKDAKRRHDERYGPAPEPAAAPAPEEPAAAPVLPEI